MSNEVKNQKLLKQVSWLQAEGVKFKKKEKKVKTDLKLWEVLNEPGVDKNLLKAALGLVN